MTKKKKILLFGSTSIGGHVVYYYLKETDKYDIVDVSLNKKLTKDTIILDLFDSKLVAELVRSINPDFIINCANVLIKESATHPERAIYINAYFPYFLKKLIANTKTKLVQISTDCVFSGKKGNYSEADFKDADSIYGRTRALGEINDNKNVNLRTSIIGPELDENGEELFNWFMHQKGTISGYKTAIWSGVTTLELAKAIDFVIGNNNVGLCNLTNGVQISKFELLKLFNQIWRDNSIVIVPNDGNYIDRSLCKTEFGYHVPDYPLMLNELSLWMSKHRELYKNVY
jgi:dTDP-4-dehydrorhamnose reductase